VSDAERFTERTSGRGIAYRLLGSGAPIVLLHGWCLDRRMWMYQEEALAATHRVISPDLPGFGASRGLAGPYTLERYTDELAALLAELGLGGATVCGFAFGAMVALSAVAAGKGRHIGRVIAIGVPSASSAPYPRMPKAMRRDWPEFARRSAQAILKNAPSQATLDWLAAMYGSTALPVALAGVEILASFEPVAIAQDVNVPTLFIHGADDDVVPPRVSQDCAAKMRDARVELVAGSGHLAVLDQPQRVAELIAAFAA
jgi:pimeloyl-ACP methyl ester carboxylesterase